jgi:homocysteine S-methyltransferase
MANAMCNRPGPPMTRVTASGFESTGKPAFICDFSPPRSGNPRNIPASIPEADFLMVNRNPGRAVRADSAMLAAELQRRTGSGVIFALLTRDMNRLAVQSYLLGAQLLGLENLVVARGDSFSPSDAGRVAAVSDYRPTELIAHVSCMNQGTDFRGRKLDSPTNFCIGATIDPGQDPRRQAALAHRKVTAGANFLITQPVYAPEEAARFLEAYAELAGGPCPAPVYWGLQILEAGSAAFGAVPPRLQGELAAGRSGVDLALEVYSRFLEASLRNVYLLPTIRQGGERGYEAAQEFLTAVRAIF